MKVCSTVIWAVIWLFKSTNRSPDKTFHLRKSFVKVTISRFVQTKILQLDQMTDATKNTHTNNTPFIMVVSVIILFKVKSNILFCFALCVSFQALQHFVALFLVLVVVCKQYVRLKLKLHDSLTSLRAEVIHTECVASASSAGFWCYVLSKIVC